MVMEMRIHSLLSRSQSGASVEKEVTTRGMRDPMMMLDFRGPISKVLREWTWNKVRTDTILILRNWRGHGAKISYHSSPTLHTLMTSLSNSPLQEDSQIKHSPQSRIGQVAQFSEACISMRRLGCTSREEV